eukprot:1930399-Rhodomonas_salina.2
MRAGAQEPRSEPEQGGRVFLRREPVCVSVNTAVRERAARVRCRATGCGCSVQCAVYCNAHACACGAV